MGIDWKYRLGQREFEFKLVEREWNVAQKLRAHLSREVETLLDVPELGDEVATTVGELRNAAEVMLEFLEEHPDVLPRTYEYKYEHLRADTKLPPHVKFTPKFKSGEQTGFQLPGEPNAYYGIRAGMDECTLYRVGRCDGGVVERDLRGVSEIQTSSHGMLTIRSRPTRTVIRSFLKRVIAFFKDEADETGVIKTAG